MKAALALFSKDDFNRVTMRFIAKDAGIVPSNIYKYFKNKDELITELLGTVTEHIVKNAEKQVLPSENTREKIYKLTSYYLDFYQNNQGVAYLIYGRNTLQHWYEYHSIYKRARELGDMLVRIVKEGQRKGDVRKDVDIHLVSHIYHGGLRNLVTSWIYHKHDFQLPDLAVKFADFIYFSISAGSPGTDTFVCPYYKEHNKVVNK
jgi:TetR/AcrR family transcriptional regulator, fatty acid metabolism regulator protein